MRGSATWTPSRRGHAQLAFEAGVVVDGVGLHGKSGGATIQRAYARRFQRGNDSTSNLVDLVGGVVKLQRNWLAGWGTGLSAVGPLFNGDHSHADLTRRTRRDGDDAETTRATWWTHDAD